MEEASPREVIKWLESPEGRDWSRSVHRQTQHAVRWFSLKPDFEGESGSDADLMDNVIHIDLGHYSRSGIRFFRKPRYSDYESYYPRYKKNL
jgi:hypothetical protein